MASSGDSGGNNLVTEFEKAYAETLATLKNEDTMYNRSPETLRRELDAKILRFTDLARQLETFFLQKRFLLHAHKPELLLREDSTELKQELARKDELLRKHYEKLGQWQGLLQEVQQQQQQGTAVPTSGAPPRHQMPKPGPGPGPAVMGGPRPMGQFPASPSYRVGVPGSPGGGGMGGGGPLAYLEKTTTSIGTSGTNTNR